jgi:hypothetical protein
MLIHTDATALPREIRSASRERRPSTLMRRPPTKYDKPTYMSRLDVLTLVFQVEVKRLHESEMSVPAPGSGLGMFSIYKKGSKIRLF